MFCLRNKMCKAGFDKLVSHSGMFDEEDVVKDVWRHGEKMSHQGSADVYFIQKSVELIIASTDISKSFADPMPFLKKLL